MEASRLLLLVFVVGAATEPSGMCSDGGSAEHNCDLFDVEKYSLSEGESLYFVPYALKFPPEQNVTWSRRTSSHEEEEEEEDIPTEENQRLHSHGKALFLLRAELGDSGLYTAMNNDSSGMCSCYFLKIKVFKMSNEIDKRLLFGRIQNSDENKRIPCPQPITFTCEQLRGNFSWRKDSKPIEGQHGDHLWVKADVGVYTCVCGWTHGGVEYKSLGSRRLQLGEPIQHRQPEIVSPANKQQFADKGAGIKLNCSVSCGTNVKGSDCRASWHLSGVSLSRLAEYNQTTEIVTEDSAKNTISTAVLTIGKVSAEDFNAVFECRGEGMFKSVNATLTLKRRESAMPLVVAGVCVLLLFLCAAALVKWFALDLALFFRPCFSRRNKDGRMFDAYVVYQTQSQDKVTEDVLTQFIGRTLPSILEEKCGYRLFIHGRDDIPGEDRLELVEGRMKQSRRLMVILPPGSGSDRPAVPAPPPPLIGGYDWQVGLHHALLQREMSVILIQLGDAGPQGYSHLPAGLQHLILQSAPIRWCQKVPGAGSWNSRFWKRVRYLMPPTPARRRPPSAVI